MQKIRKTQHIILAITNSYVETQGHHNKSGSYRILVDFTSTYEAF